MAGPRFPVGGRAPIRGGVDLRCGHFSVKMYGKMKELGPMGGGVRPARPPRFANAVMDKNLVINNLPSMLDMYNDSAMLISITLFQTKGLLFTYRIHVLKINYITMNLINSLNDSTVVLDFYLLL